MSEPTDTARDFGPTALPGIPPLPVDADVEPVEEVDDLSALRADLAQQVTAQVITLPVATRHGLSVRYRCDVSQPELDAWRKASKDRKRGDGIAGERFAALILANKCVAIVRAGREVTDEGEPLTFRSTALLEMVGAGRVADAVAKFYGADSAVDSAARAVLLDSGWGDDVLVEALDEDSPTRAGRG